jgi:myo-inositol-1(or 4)-monophosphatase
MTPSPTRLRADAFEPLLQALREAGQNELLPRFQGRLAVAEKPDGSLVTSADHAVDARLRTVFDRLFPGIPVLSEEQDRGEQEAVLADAERFWLMDPLDGTTNFASGMPFFAISVALVGKNGVYFGATYDPVRDELFSAVHNGGLHLNGQPPPPRPREAEDLAQCTALVDCKRLAPPLGTALILNPPYRSQRNLGACALEWAWLAAGRADLYLHGGQALWDSAAGTVMLAEVGGCLTDLEGRPVFRRSLEKPSAVATRAPALHRLWLDWLQGHQHNEAPSADPRHQG